MKGCQEKIHPLISRLLCTRVFHQATQPSSTRVSACWLLQAVIFRWALRIMNCGKSWMDFKSCAVGEDLVLPTKEQTVVSQPPAALLLLSCNASAAGPWERWAGMGQLSAGSSLLPPKIQIANPKLASRNWGSDGDKELMSAVPFNDRLLAATTEVSCRVNFC